MLERLCAFLPLTVVWLMMVFLLVRRVRGERYSVFPPSRRIPPRGGGEVPPQQQRVTVHYCRAFDAVLHQTQNTLMDIERCAACIAATIEKEGADE